MQEHPIARPTIVALSILILIGAYLVLAESKSFWPYSKATPSSSEAGVAYKNTDYGFQVKLPDNWRGFTVETSTRDIYSVISGDKTGSAPTISLHNPLETKTQPRQAIPIDVYTLEQWAKIQKGELSVGAAPIPPSELARNSKYVFALPARYNYAFPEGWQEVETIIQSKPVSAF